MSMTFRELWTSAHGMVFGALFLIAFAGGLAGLYSMRPALLTAEGIRERVKRVKLGTGLMALVAWITVLTGTYIVYPWYRAAPPEGVSDLTAYPRSLLLGNENISGWHIFGMEWKEHVVWISLILVTVVFYIVYRYGSQLAEEKELRNMTMIIYIIAFAAAAIAGLFGALITKAAPVM